MPKLRMVTHVYALYCEGFGYMPLTKTNRGYTWLSLNEWHPSEPRLFWSYSGANLALYNWKRGPLTKGKYRDTLDEQDFIPGGTVNAYSKQVAEQEKRSEANIKIV
jgi:hypothetical protein